MSVDYNKRAKAHEQVAAKIREQEPRLAEAKAAAKEAKKARQDARKAKAKAKKAEAEIRAEERKLRLQGWRLPYVPVLIGVAVGIATGFVFAAWPPTGQWLWLPCVLGLVCGVMAGGIVVLLYLLYKAFMKILKRDT
jgi:uncharacterized membrane protein YcjF (UPF0283 family)